MRVSKTLTMGELHSQDERLNMEVLCTRTTMAYGTRRGGRTRTRAAPWGACTERGPNE